MRYLIFIFLLGICHLNGQGQVLDSSFLASFSVRNIGPAGMSGRVTSIDVDLSNPERIFIGTASGGVWKSTDGGVHWEPVFDEAATLSIGAVTIDQSNPSIIWTGTGEGNPRNSHNSGKGIYKTLDGGRTWKLMGLEKTRLIHRILIDHHNPNTVYAGALGSAWGPNPERGVYKTTDGGKTWEKILFVNDSTGVADMIMDPFNPNKILVAMWEYGRKPWIFDSGGKGSGLYMTHDGGATWKRMTHEDGLPKGELGRMGIAIARSKPDIIYALIEAKENGLYKSVDGGFTWKLVSKENIGNRPFYYSEIYVDPQNENRIWNLWSYLSKSEDGGKTFETILDYGKGVHPDHHAFWQHPTEPNYIIEGNDGGLNISYDRGRNWRFVTNIPVGQFYHINIDNAYPYNVYGGMQDNGSWIGPAFVLKNGGIRNADWREVYFGDGFDVMPRRDNLRYGWAMSQGGNLSYYDKMTGDDVFVRPVHPEAVELRFNWNAALARDPFSDCGIYYGSQFVHYSNDCGLSWEVLSPDLTTNDTAKQLQHKSGGLTIDDTEAENFTTILAIEPSIHEKNVIWVGTDDGYLQLTKDRGVTWSELSSRLPGLPQGTWIPQIRASSINPGEAFVVANNYRRNDWSAYLYHTTDYGETWRRLTGENYNGGFVVSVIQDQEVPSLLFLGADDGLYVSIDYGKTWSKWPDAKFPPVQVRDLQIQTELHDLVIGTFGRAIWVVDNILPLREMARTSSGQTDKDFAVSPSPPAYLSAFRSVDGIRFTADAEFRGDNKGRGADIRIWLKPVEDKKGREASEDAGESKGGKKKKEKAEVEMTVDTAQTEVPGEKKKEKEKLAIHILNESRDTIRYFTRKLEPGMQTISWNLRKDGVRYPTRRKIDEEDESPAGSAVLPGNYTLIFTYQEFSDSMQLEVRPDPRIDVAFEALVAGAETVKAYEALVNMAFTAFEQLKKVRRNVALVEESFAYAPDSIKTMIKDKGKNVRKSLDSLEALFMLPEDSKGIQDDSETLNHALRRASSYLRSARGVPGQNALHALAQAKLETIDVVNKVNTFLDTEWENYKTSVSAWDVELFDTLEAVELKE